MLQFLAGFQNFGMKFIPRGGILYERMMVLLNNQCKHWRMEFEPNWNLSEALPGLFVDL